MTSLTKGRLVMRSCSKDTRLGSYVVQRRALVNSDIHNWIGDIRPGKARFVSPSSEMVNDMMRDLEKFSHDETQQLPALIKAALVHVQFETIHPFLDGNSRLGRVMTRYLRNQSLLIGEARSTLKVPNVRIALQT